MTDYAYAPGLAPLPMGVDALYNWFPRRQLQRTATAKAAALAGTGSWVINCIGDSGEMGEGAGTGSPLQAGAQPFAIPVRLAQALVGQGFNATSDNFWGGNGCTNIAAIVGYDTRLVAGAGWTGAGKGSGSSGCIGGQLIANTTTTNALEFTPVGRWDTAVIYYGVNTGLGTFTADVGGSVLATQATAGTLALGSVTVPTGAAADVQTLYIKRTTGGVYIVGVECYDSLNPGVRVRNIGEASSTAAIWNRAGFPYQPFPALPVLGGDTTFIRLARNDQFGGVSAATFKSRMVTLTEQVKVYSDPILIFGHQPEQTVFPTPDDAGYYAVLQEVADQFDCPLISVPLYMGDFEQSNAHGWMASDEIHENANGMLYEAIWRTGLLGAVQVMADVTYADLTALSLPIQDADLLAAFRGAGPLQRLMAVDLKDYVGSGTFLPLDGSDPMTGPLLLTAGTVGAPGLAASGDANTGVFFPSADAVAIATGGLERMRWYSTGVNILVPIVQLVPLTPPQGRLTLTSAFPVTTGDVTAATTVYYTPYNGGSIPINDVANSVWKDTPCVELSVPLSATYHTTNTNYDLYVVNDNGTLRLVTSEAWSSDTTRGTTAALTRVEGIAVNNALQTMRWGTSVGNTVSVAAQSGTYVGTIRTVAAGQTEDSTVKRFVFNAYNRVRRLVRVLDGTDNWTVSSETWQQLNGSTANQVAMVRGLDEDTISLTVAGTVSVDNGNRWGNVGVGLDSTTTNSAVLGSTGVGAAGYFASMGATYAGLPGLGYHYLAALQRIRVADSTYTFYGDNAGDQGFVTGMVGEITA